MATMQTIVDLARAEPIDMKALGEAFDDATPEDRVAAIRHFSPKIQRRLFDAAAGQRVTLAEIVPPGKEALTEVIHEGQNTLPAFRAFQKRFCRPSPANTPEDREVLWGYNHQTFSGVTGPGYYVAYDDKETGEVVVDYRELPPEHPENWPVIIDNKAKLGRFVYYGMVDRLRRVSEHVTIGRAYKAKPMSAWFVLVRQD